VLYYKYRYLHKEVNMKNSLLKSIRFNMDDESDKELYDFLSHLKRGAFSKATKLFWKTRMEIDKERKNPEYIYMKEMAEKLRRIEILWLSDLDNMEEREGK
jgi:hypothetical protein